MHRLTSRQVFAPGLWLRAALLGCAVLLWGMAAQAQQEPDYPAMALKWARANAAASLPGDAAQLRLDISVGALDARLRLAPCGNVEPYLPPGSRLWGNGRVGLRCMDGVSRWNVSVPVQVKAIGKTWVVRNPVAMGNALTQADMVLAEVDWAEETTPVLSDVSMWLGQTATRPLTTGQVLRQGMVRPTQVFQPGTQVRVVAQGPGFQISSDAQALSAGVVGQPARVRMDNGRVTNGTVLDAHTVKIEI